MDMTVRPGDFPIGSVESRAAVRAMIDRERSEDSRPFLRVFVFHPPHDCKGEVCLQPSEEGPRLCHQADKPLRRTPGPNGRTYYDVFMNMGRA